MWKNKTVTVVLPTYNEKDSITRIIHQYYESGYVDEVIVVNNNAAQGTREAVQKTKAVQLFESKQGYGFAIRKGMDEAKGDLIVISEPDGTFAPQDIVKLLAYSDDYDAVWGTRTDVRFIGEGANMDILLRSGNLFVAKLFQFLFNTTRLSDVGCTYKLFKKQVIEKVKNDFTVGKEHFGVELMILVALEGFNIVEIPVNYHKRVGKSSVTGDPVKTFFLALKMIKTIFYYYLHKPKPGKTKGSE